MLKIRNVKDVVEWRMCIGCGACAYICPYNKIELVDIPNDGIRPIVDTEGCDSCTECLDVCPGFNIVNEPIVTDGELNRQLTKSCGKILEIWEGYTTDKEMCYLGSSAGVASALALYCIEKEGMNGVLHIGSDLNNPFRNRTYLSKNREEILAKTGSRYAPASPCDTLHEIETSSRPCIFIGKPCDVTALRKAQNLKPELDKRVGLAISIFCAGTPSTQATLDLLKANNINPNNVKEIRYRGKGWPGMFIVELKNEKTAKINITYKESWGFLQAYRPFRCHLCPEGTGDSADISCGDPWYRQIEEDMMGSSLILVRTVTGKELLKRACEAGIIKLKRLEPHYVTESQKNLIRKRSVIWGRILVLKAFGIPSPKLKGFYLFHNWMKASFLDKVKSILGTAKRIIIRKYTKRKKIEGLV